MQETSVDQSWATVARGNTHTTPKNKRNSAPKARKQTPAKWETGKFYNVTHLQEDDQVDDAENLRLPPRKIMDIASRHAVIVNVDDGQSLGEIVDAISQIAPGALIRPNRRAKQLLVACTSNTQAIHLATNPPTVQGSQIKAFRPVLRSENMTVVCVTVSTYIGTLTEATRKIAGALRPYGDVVDLSACLWPNGTMTGTFNAILGRGQVNESIPHSLAVSDTWAQVFGKEVTPWCVYCRQEGHIRHNCPKRLCTENARDSTQKTQAKTTTQKNLLVKPPINKSEHGTFTFTSNNTRPTQSSVRSKKGDRKKKIITKLSMETKPDTNKRPRLAMEDTPLEPFYFKTKSFVCGEETIQVKNTQDRPDSMIQTTNENAMEDPSSDDILAHTDDCDMDAYENNAISDIHSQEPQPCPPAVHKMVLPKTSPKGNLRLTEATVALDMSGPQPSQ